MKFSTCLLLVFLILAIVLFTMFPIPAIVVALSVAIWAVIAAEKEAARLPARSGFWKKPMHIPMQPDGCLKIRTGGTSKLLNRFRGG